VAFVRCHPQPHQECGQQYCKSGNSHFHGVCTEHSLQVPIAQVYRLFNLDHGSRSSS